MFVSATFFSVNLVCELILAKSGSSSRTVADFKFINHLKQPLAWTKSISEIRLREVVKYYFADFVRKGGTPPPFTDKIFAKKKLRIWGVPPPPPLRTFPPIIVFKKC